jgi:hypothetical protein
MSFMVCCSPNSTMSKPVTDPVPVLRRRVIEEFIVPDDLAELGEDDGRDYCERPLNDAPKAENDNDE